ncbi:HNH endonuclease [Citrobacter portucalensis]|uniref:HNH endonuclease n=5 Tax=Citrobacter portucalensis TaxID=1639133 RepID=UPI0018AACF2C|nr:HNH endonuclease [Citrobacter portucalensis]MBJ8682229.1 HNH endonuclease [Citrobacter freundii]MBW9452909.1 HNH endonuclease [Citrobacter portucalensis]MBW9456874.1 HNH endonuclease [Citrobacter portucalensis]MCC2941776.1 HNH endonuclease [Citrobacter freundii]MEB0323262.1 HNH endonuclease [Citrobacter portucalensis]
MTTCIICRLEKDNMSDEHVIPDSLGGYYHIHTVCRDCNSLLGTQVDTHLINNKFGELYRSHYNLKGKTGGIPNPFGGTFTSEEDPEMKATYRRKKDGSYEPYFMTHSKFTKNSEGEIIGLTLSLDESDLEQQESILEKILTRNNLKKSDVTRTEFNKVENKSVFKSTWSMNFENMKIGALKIAYEFAVDSINEYFHDKSAIKISQILMQGDIKAAAEYVNIGDGINEEIIKPFEPYIDTEKNRHFLILTKNKNSLFCLVRINGVYTIGVTLSKKNYLTIEESIIGINDIENKKFNKIKFIDGLNSIQGPIKLNFLFKGKSITEIEHGFEPFEHSNTYTSKDLIPLYDQHKTCITLVHEVVEKTNPYKDILANVCKKGSTFKIPLPHSATKYHVLSKHTNSYHEVDEIEIKQTWLGCL